MSIGPLGPGGPGQWDDLFARFFGAAEPRRAAQRIDIARYMSNDARRVLADAARRAADSGPGDGGPADLDTDHLLWAVLQQEPMKQTVRRAGADPQILLSELELRVGDESARIASANRRAEMGAVGLDQPEQVSLTPAAKRALLDSLQISRAMGASYIGPEHILMALGLNTDSVAGRLLAGRLDTRAIPNSETPTGPVAGGQGGSRVTGRAAPATPTPTLEQFGVDLTEMARRGEIDPVIGRADEIEQAVEILSRRTKNNPVLIGEAGVGKTAIVEGLAQRIVDGDVPLTLQDKRVVQLDLAGLVAGTRYRGDFEERLRKIIDEIQASGDGLVVFLDEIHTLVGAGGGGEGGGMDAGNMLKPALARGRLRVIGATTLDEYRKHIEKDAALARRFQPVQVGEPSVEDAVAILRGLRDNYEAHHQVRITDEALDAAALLSDRYIADRFLPDKAIDLIDQAGARVRLRTKMPDADLRERERQLEQLSRDRDQAVAAENYEVASQLRDRINELKARITGAGAGADGVPRVTADDIAEMVARATGIPVAQLTETERDRLLGLEEHLHEHVVGQDDAVTAVAEAVRRSRAGLGDPGRPVGSFLFLGPTGVGKTELARSLAEALFGDADRMVRLDMSEFQERHAVSRLVGAPPGYVGYDEAGQLTEAVRRRPYSVVLLDELEKAHHDVFNILLQVLDDGRLTDSQGRTVSFKNTVLIMTSNLGSDLINGSSRSVGFGGAENGRSPEDDLRDRLDRRLKEQLRPEFINRIDEIIIFRQLETEQLRKITEMLLESTRRRLDAQDVRMEITTAAVDWLADKGYQPEFGARPLRRTIQRELDNRLSKMLLAADLAPGRIVRVDVRDGELTFEIESASLSTR
ncbi:ATP-dependent Clp protease ATP-binding subunit [Actinoplanes regularis]|uniref:ATP-dependent Clp protease ATP-binding subunit ClpC n=1 Tax=Actinoplanes regularis TaxID=52697 RepID=A0A238XVL4_9ACTN|nr:ATP-dependent Clp protease ATP-binding subunit [Actinoplanes regularis]GIE87760.1 ATPase AAA [Actinoplanes regularis]SNR62730.1 ATP-dependent Clp protease ATP-binding subunit ClpC [Actinoplanes regularis]